MHGLQEICCLETRANIYSTRFPKEPQASLLPGEETERRSKVIACRCGSTSVAGKWWSCCSKSISFSFFQRISRLLLPTGRGTRAPSLHLCQRERGNRLIWNRNPRWKPLKNWALLFLLLSHMRNGKSRHSQGQLVQLSRGLTLQVSAALVPKEHMAWGNHLLVSVYSWPSRSE